MRKLNALYVHNFGIAVAILLFNFQALAGKVYNDELSPNIFIVAKNLEPFAMSKMESLIKLTYKSCEDDPTAAKEFCAFKKSYRDWQSAANWLVKQSTVDFENLRGDEEHAIDIHTGWEELDLTTVTWAFSLDIDTTDPIVQERVSKKVLAWVILKRSLASRIDIFKQRMLKVLNPKGISLYWTTIPSINAWSKSSIPLKQIIALSDAMMCSGAIACDFQKRALKDIACNSAKHFSERAKNAVEAMKQKSLFYDEKMNRLAEVIDLEKQISSEIDNSLLSITSSGSIKNYVTSKKEWSQSDVQFSEDLQHKIFQAANFPTTDLALITQSFMGVKVQAIVDVANQCPAKSQVIAEEQEDLKLYKGAIELEKLIVNELETTIKELERILTNLNLEIQND